MRFKLAAALLMTILVVGQPDVGPFTGIPVAPAYPEPIALDLRWP
ncbi:MAG TPA: hypothetical protein VGK48_11840 [Terriglobia bacterium]